MYQQNYPQMIFVTNKENSNNLLFLEHLPDSMIPIRLSHSQVIDKFTDYVLSKDVCDLCLLKSDKDLHLDHNIHIAVQQKLQRLNLVCIKRTTNPVLGKRMRCFILSDLNFF